MKKTLYIVVIALILMPSLLLAEDHTLSEWSVIEQVIIAAPDTLIARERLGQSEAALMSTKGQFDTNFNGNFDHTQDEFKRSSDFFGTRQDTTNWNMGLAKAVPVGMTVGIDWANQREKLFNTPTIAGMSIFPRGSIYESTVRFYGKVSLLKNVIGINDRANLNSAKKALQSADSQTKFTISAIAYNSLIQYWQWVVSFANISAWNKAIGDARDFLDITKERARLGISEKTDLLSAEALVTGRERGQLEAIRLRDELEASLKTILGYTEYDNVKPLQKYPKQPHGLDLNIDSAIRQALEARWDLIAQKKEVERRKIILASEDNKRWPSLDVTGSFGINELTGDYSKTLDDLDSPSYTVGANFSFPLENRIARGNYNNATHENKKAIIELKKLEIQIVNSVAELVRRVRTSKKVLAKAQKAQRLQSEKLKEEMKNYGMGRSNSLTITQYQNDLLLAEINTLSSWNQYISAALNLKLATNTLVDL